MKRFLALFLTIIMLLSLFVSCKPNDDPQETTPEATTPEETTPASTTPEETTTPDEGGQIMPPKQLLATEILELLNPSQSFDATFDCQETIIRDVAPTGDIMSINVIRSAFTNEGFKQLEVNMVEGAKFETILLTRGEELVTIYWIPDEKEARITVEKADEAALSVLQKNASTGGGTLTMVQIGVARGEAPDNPMIGMCYVFKLSNGNAMIIDGGYYYDDCATNLYNALAKLDIAKTEDDKFIIEAWIFTHGHGDHNGILNNFAPLYGDKTEVNYFLYQLPVNNKISATGGGLAGEEAFHELCKTAYPNATYINPHVGLNYYFGNATVSMLYTPDVLWAPDNKITYYNDTSLIFNVHGGGTSFLCMGDAGDIAAERSWSLFDAHAFESGVLQITHHGLTTGEGSNSHVWDNIMKIYQAAGVSYAVLPMGTRIGDSVVSGDWKNGNGRWAVIFQYAYNGGQMSFFVKLGDAPTSSGYFNHELFTRFVATVETGHNYLAEMASAYKNVKSLHGYNGINMIDNGNGLITYISSRDKEEMATVFQFAKGSVTVKKNEELSEWLKLPEFNAADVVATLNPTSTFESTFGSTEAIVEQVSNVKPILDAFQNAEFSLLSISTVDDAKFETFILSNDAELVTIYYRSAIDEVRIIWEKLDENILSTLSPNTTTGTGELTFVQIGVERVNETDNPMIGLCYVVKLANGNAIVIDGGANNAKCAENIYKTLSKLNVTRNEAGQYVIEAWIFTHGHSDHNGVLNAFAESYTQKVDVLNFIYQVPSNGDVSAIGAGVAGEAAFHALCKEAYPNATYINPKTGVNYYFSNATVSMLYTPDVLWSPENKITYYNDTSLIFTVRGGGTGFLCFGDAGELAATTSWSLFDESAYKSGLFQITHHGLTTQDGAYGNDWEYVGKIYEATGSNLVVLPLGETNLNDSRNGRYTVLFQYGYNGYHMSYIVNKDNAPFASKYFNAAVFDAFIEDVETGSTRMQDEFNLGSYKTLYGYNGINMIDNGAGRITYIASRDKAPMVTVFTFANGEVTVKTNQELYDWLEEPTLVDSFESTFDSDMEIYTNVKSKDLFVDKFVADGYTLLDVDNVDGARFETILLQKESELVVLYWFPEDQDMRVLYETVDPDALAPLTPNEETGKGEVTLIQIGIERDHRDPNIATDKGNPMIGMCYIMKLSNGKAIVIDGGFTYETNADNLYNALVELDIAKNEDGKFMIEAWIFSHGHGDHNGIMTSFGAKYADKTDVNYIIYQLPTNNALADVGGGIGEATFHELCKTTFPNATYILPHAGLKYYFGNATIDVLYTPDLIWSPSNRLPDYNDTSIVTRWQAGGTAFLSFGDAGEVPATALWKYYETTAFKSSILQITHHGLTTGANESQEWRNLKKVYEGAGVQYTFMPMGSAYGSRNGRWSVLCGWGYTGGQASFCLNREDDAAGVDQTAYANFVNGVRDGSITDKTFLGYNGINMIDNGQGRITYIASSEDVPMVTIFTFAGGEATVQLNQELYTWLEK